MAAGDGSNDANLTPEQRAARRAAANTAPRGTSIVGPTAGRNPLAFGTGNTFNVGDGQEIRLVDGQGNVLFSGSGAEDAARAVAMAQSISDEYGGNAAFTIQTGERTINPDGSVGGTRYIDVARAAPSQSGLGFLADYVLPFAASFIPGVGPVLGAALGSGASSAAQGRSLQDTLTRAAVAAGGAYLGGQASNLGGSTPVSQINSDLIPNALEGLSFGGLTSAAIPAGVGGAAGDILVNAALNTGSNLAGSTLGNLLSSSLLPLTNTSTSTGGDTSSTTADDTIVVTGARPGAVLDSATTGAVTGAATGNLLDALTNTSATTGTTADDTIVVTGARPGAVTDAATGAVAGATTGGLLNTLGDVSALANDIVVTGNQTTGGNTGAATTAGTTGLLNTGTGTDTIVVTGNRPGAVTDTSTGAVTNAATTGLLNTLTGGTSTGNTTTSERGGVLGTGLTIGELLSILGVGGNLIGNLVGGSSGSGTGTTSTYVSPFGTGTGTGLGTGRDMRANPNITDYERYGFGPEAMFFTPGYSSVFSAGNPATQTQSTTTTTTNR